MKSRCAACRAYTPPQGSQGYGWCRSPKSKRGTFVVGQDKSVRPDYGCVHHEPRVAAQGELLGEAA